MAVKKVTTEKAPAAEKTKKPVVKVAKVAAEKTEKVAKVTKVAKTPAAPVKEKAEKVEKVAVEKEIVRKVKEVYFYAVGRRKTSVAQVRLFADEKATDADLMINGKKLKEYFPTISLQNNFLAPLKAVGMYGKMRMTVLVRGGGVTGQVEATRLGISRALVKSNEELKKTLKDLGFMTRDAREVERKKPGLKGARKAPQWAKR